NGFDPNGVLTMELKVSRSRGRAELSPLLHRVLQSVQAQPGVDKAALSAALPGLSDGWQNDIAVEGEGPRKKGELINVDWSIVTTDYFQTMRIPVLREAKLTGIK